MTGSAVEVMLEIAAHSAPRETMAAGARLNGECLTASCSDRLRPARAISEKGMAHG
jgi:hypothetical protein